MSRMGFTGRSYGETPEDGLFLLVMITKIGEFTDVRITRAFEYDLLKYESRK